MKNNLVAKNLIISREELDNLRANILKKILQLNIKLPKLAELIGMPYQSLWRITYEEKYTPNISSLYNIADFLEVSVADLLKSPDLPQYIPIINFNEVENFLNDYLQTNLYEKVLSPEYIHESAFAIQIKQQQFNISFTSTFIFKPYNKIKVGVFLIKSENKILAVNILKVSTKHIEAVDISLGNLYKMEVNSLEILAIAIKQIVYNSLI